MRILTGLQPSGKLHIGNYFGAMEPAVKLQDEGEAFYFIADYHAMTSMTDAATLRANVEDLAIDFLSCGLDPNKATIFRQSDIPEVNELAWILSTVCPMGLLQRCHSYKDKIDNGLDANHALFAYPALMAADILLYDANLVPVGKDQKQHLEVTRDLAGKINDKFGDGTLVVPKAQIREESAVVPGLDGQKMSKSYGNTIPLTGAQKATRKLFMKIITSSHEVAEAKPTDSSTLIAIYQLFADKAAVQAMINEHGLTGEEGKGYGYFKQQLFEAYWEKFASVRARREELEKNLDHVWAVIADGALRAREESSKVLTRVKKTVGLR